MRLAVIGCGHVGLVIGACFSDSGHRVICADIDREAIEGLKKGKPHFYEPGLEELIRRTSSAGKLRFTTNTASAVVGSDAIFIAVSTPPRESGEADIRNVVRAALDIARSMDGYKLVVNVSTVPVGTAEKIAEIIRENSREEFDVASNPEFLREGTAIADRIKPDRIVIGANSERAIGMLKEIYAGIDAPMLVTDVRTAEVIKYASNAFLATKISFINEIAHLCELVGADVEGVAEGMGYDPRIGKGFLKAGLGYGGSCFPKDTRALDQICSERGHNFKLLRAVIDVNNGQRVRFVEKIKAALGGSLSGKTIAVLGLSFKPNTDDVRESAAIDVIRLLLEEGAEVRAYDPRAMEKAKGVLPGAKFSADPYEACRGSHALAIATEWPEFRELDFARIKALLKKPIVADGRNFLDPAAVKKSGLEYIGVGRAMKAEFRSIKESYLGSLDRKPQVSSLTA